MARPLVSLADLLLALRQADAADQPKLAAAFGAEWLPPAALQGQEGPEADDGRAAPKPPAPRPTAEAPAPAASSPVYWRVASDTRNPDLRDQPPAWLTALPAPDPAVFQAPAGAQPPALLPLLPMARFARRMR